MKTRFELLTLAAALTLTAATVQAGDLTIPNTFVSGTKALAEQVNANFTATQTAVNSKQNKITGACGTALYVKQVNADGTLVCDNPVGTPVPTSISVHAASFAPNRSSCAYQLSHIEGYFISGTGCSLLAGIHLPIGATVTGFSCRIEDSSAATSAHLRIYLDRLNLVNNAVSNVGSSLESTSTGRELLQGAIVVGNELVLAERAYSIDVVFGPVDLATTTGLKLYGCTVNYTP